MSPANLPRPDWTHSAAICRAGTEAWTTRACHHLSLHKMQGDGVRPGRRFQRPLPRFPQSGSSRVSCMKSLAKHIPKKPCKENVWNKPPLARSPFLNLAIPTHTPPSFTRSAKTTRTQSLRSPIRYRPPHTHMTHMSHVHIHMYTSYSYMHVCNPTHTHRLLPWRATRTR